MDPNLLRVRIFESWWLYSVYFEIVFVSVSWVEQAIEVELHQAFAKYWRLNQSKIKVSFLNRLE